MEIELLWNMRNKKISIIEYVTSIKQNLFKKLIWLISVLEIQRSYQKIGKIA